MMITMKRLTGAAMLLLATRASAQSCPQPLEVNGNYYCSQVDAITYTSVGGNGSYDKVTSMGSNTATCSSEPYGYSGSLSPLNEEVSLHVRGPCRLLQFAMYTPGESSRKKTRRSEHEHAFEHAKAHMHAHARHHARNVHRRDVGDTVTATIYGQIETWTNQYSGSPVSSPTSVSECTYTLARASSSLAPESSAPPSNGSSGPSLSGSWGRQGYYNSQESVANGIVFLNHFGGTGSGVFDYSFGSSLSYASSDGCTGASTPQVLQDTTLPSGAEIVIMSDSECGANNDECGYYRPGTVAYQGFVGADKAFFFEFEMPDDGQTTTDIYDPVNMPAIWMLNAQIPRTLQYGNADCSCWTSGCGEFDIFEVLSPGYDKARSTIHGNIAGGSSDWFPRPINGSVKVGVMMIDDCIHIKILDSGMEFGSSLAADVVQEIVDSTMTQSQSVALFSLEGAGGG